MLNHLFQSTHEPNFTSSYFTINPDITYVLIDDEAVIIAAENDQLYSTNASATELLQILKKAPSTIPMMQAYLMEQYEVNAAKCLCDVENLITALLKENLVMKVDYQP